MTDTLADILLMLLVRQGRSGIAYRVEIIGIDVRAVHGAQQVVEDMTRRGACLTEGDERYLTVMMVKDDDIPIEDITHVRGIVLLHGLILHGNILEVAHGIERRIAIESAERSILAFHLEVIEEVVDDMMRTIVVIELTAHHTTIWEGADALTMTDGHGGDGVDTDERTTVVGIVVIGALHQGTLRIEVAQPHIYTYRRIEVTENRSAFGDIMETYILIHKIDMHSNRFQYPCRHDR